MNYTILKAETQADPLDRGYSNMSDVEVAADLNTVYRSRDRPSMSGSEVLNAIDKAELFVLSDVEKARMWQLLHLGELNPFGVEADLLVEIFGDDSETITALQAARKEDVSRAEELGLGTVYEGTIQQARAM